MARTEQKNLRRKVRNSYIISSVSIAMVLFLLGSVGYLLYRAMLITDSMKENFAMFIMLKDSDGEEQRKTMRAELEAMQEIKDVVYVSKSAAAEDFKAHLNSDFESFLEFNPLPDSFEITLNAEFSNPDIVRELDKRFAAMKGVDEVVYQKSTIESLTTNINKANFVLLLFGGTLLVISLILLNNTIRISIYSRRHLINTMKLVGASKGFIMRPFIKESLLQGILSWVIGGALFMLAVWSLSDSLPELISLTDWKPVIVILVGMLLLSEIISVLFTIFAVNKFVNMNTAKIYLY